MSYYDILLAKNLSGGGGDITVESLSVTENGTYTAPSGKAYTPVSVIVPNSYTASDEGKVVSSGVLVAQTSQNIDTNGTYDTTLKNSVTVNVSGGGDSSRALAELIERTGTTIEIPQGVTKIGNHAFQNYGSLQTVTIPQGLTTIGNNAFYECTNLQDVVLPSSVTDIGNYAFRYCSKLNTITLNSAVPPTLGSLALNNINNFTIYVPSESVEAYKAATNWSSYASKIQAIPS